jgi:di/tripeptidase
LIDPLIVELQSRVADLELAKEHTEVSAAVQRERAEILIRLRKIMETMKSETGGVGGASSSKEIEQLKAENKELKRINAKQRYRIDHLVNNLRETMK